MSTKGELAIFNLELTVLDSLFEDSLSDLAGTGLIEPGHEAMSVREARSALLGWLAGKHTTEVEPLLDKTTAQSLDRTAPWARIALEGFYQSGVKVGLYSSTVPSEIVDAYADGYEEQLDIEVAVTRGKPLVKRGEVFSGETEPMLKAETIEKLTEDGYTINFIADSFRNALPAVYQARNPLIVNPGGQLRHYLKYKIPKAPVSILEWDTKRPNHTMLATAGNNAALFDLALADETAAFRDAFAAHFGWRE